MSRTAERWIWIGVLALLLLIGVGLFAGPAARMFGMCGQMMEDGMMGGGMMGQDRSAPPLSGGNSQQ